MKILALEFSSAHASVALAESDGRLLAATGEPAARATRVFALIQNALQQAQLTAADIGCIAIGLGPGSYAGIRAAIAVAQGWQLARGVRLLGISSVETLAARAHQEGRRGRLHLATDAQRGDFYLAGYEAEEAGVRVTIALHLAPRAAVEKLLAQGEVVLGPDLANAFPQALPLQPDAATLARLAASRQEAVAGETLAPIYLRETNFVKAPPPRTGL